MKQLKKKPSLLTRDLLISKLTGNTLTHFRWHEEKQTLRSRADRAAALTCTAGLLHTTPTETKSLHILPHCLTPCPKTSGNGRTAWEQILKGCTQVNQAMRKTWIFLGAEMWVGLDAKGWNCKEMQVARDTTQHLLIFSKLLELIRTSYLRVKWLKLLLHHQLRQKSG